MKKSLKTIIIICLFMVMISGCTNQTNAVTILNKSIEAMKDIKSYQSEFKMEVKLSLKDKEIKEKQREISYNGNFEYLEEEKLLHMYLNSENIELNHREYNHIESYIQEKNNKENKFMKVNDMGWIKQDDNQVSLKLIKELIPSLNLEGIKNLNPKFIKEEKLNGKDTNQIMITLNKDMKVSETLKKILNEMKDVGLDVIINIDKETNLINKYTFKIENQKKQVFVDACVKVGVLEKGVSINSFNLEIIFNHMNQIKKFEIPQEIFDITSGNIDEKASYHFVPSITSGNLETQTHLWESLNIIIDHHKFNLKDIKLNNLIDLGFKVNEFSPTLKEMKKRKLKDKEQVIVYLDKDGETLSFILRNNSGSDLKMFDCDVISIATFNVVKNFELDGNIKLGSTLDEVRNVYGEANTISNDITQTWTYTNVSGSSSLTVGFVDDVVAMLDING